MAKPDGFCYNCAINLKTKRGNVMTIETANRLYELRKQHNMSQEELAEKLGVSRQAVSKWERSEASPDTDNLIALAKIYGLSLDELIFGENQQENEQEKGEATDSSENDPITDASNGVNKVDIGPGGIFVESEDGDKVHISLKGIKITEGKKLKSDKGGVNINLGGLKFDPDAFLNDEDEDEEDEDDEDDDTIAKDGHFHVEIDKRNNIAHWFEVPYSIICLMAYLIFGFCNICGGWSLSWIIFITIPVFNSIIDAICKKRFSKFAYAVFTAFAYLYIGLYQGLWHPSWLIFLTIPIYYSIAGAIDKAIKRKNKSHKIIIN